MSLTTSDSDAQLCDQQQKVNHKNFHYMSERWIDMRLKNFWKGSVSLLLEEW